MAEAPRWPLVIGGLTLAGIVLWALGTRSSDEVRPPRESPEGTGRKPRPVSVLGDPLILRSGTRYRARLELSPLQALAGDDAVIRELTDLGFFGVRVYSSPPALPADWPRETAAAPRSGTRWAEATWGGASGAIARPAEVILAWEG